MGDTPFTAFVSPAQPGGDLGRGCDGAGADDSNEELGNDNWGLGHVICRAEPQKGRPGVYGVLVNNIWSFTSDKSGGSYNMGLIQPFINYNFKSGAYLTSSPVVTVDWKARKCSSGERAKTMGSPGVPSMESGSSEST